MERKGASRTSTTTGTVPASRSGAPRLTFTAPKTPMRKTRAWASDSAVSLYQSPLRMAPCACSMMRRGFTCGLASVATKMLPKR